MGKVHNAWILWYFVSVDVAVTTQTHSVVVYVYDISSIRFIVE